MQTDVYRVDNPSNLGEVFKIIEQDPQFGVNEDDLEQYLFSDIMLCHQSEIENGKITLQLIILENGVAHLSVVWVEGTPQLIAEPFIEKIKNMPAWTPGKQRGFVKNVQVNIVIRIIEGELSID